MSRFDAAPSSDTETADEPAVLGDREHATFGRVDGMHGIRFIEVYLAGREATTGKLVAACYNTMFTEEGLPASGDTAPQALVEGIDFAALKAEHGVLSASMNGPKIWTPDWMEAQIGPERDFNGIKAAWVAQLDIEKASGVAGVRPYVPITIARESRLGWSEGSQVMVLDDAEGNAWVMKGFQLGLRPRFIYDDFLANGERYFEALPTGWRFRVTTLERELIETPVGGVATIMADEFFNVYDLAGPPQMNGRP